MAAALQSPPQFGQPFSSNSGGRLPRSAKAGRGSPRLSSSVRTNSAGRTSSSGRTNSEDRTSSSGRTLSTDRTSSSERAVSPQDSPRSCREQFSHFDAQTPAQWTAQIFRPKTVGRQADGRPSSSPTPALAERPSRSTQNILLGHAFAVLGEEHRRSQASIAERDQLPDISVAAAFAPKTWLDDASITAVYARLVQQNELPSPHPVLLLEPSVAFWLALSKRGEDSVREAVEGLELGSRQVVMCPINDCRDGLRGDSGTHWSLLVCVACHSSAGGREFEFLHYNSDSGLSARSLRQAQRVAQQIGGRPVKVRSRPCAQQANNFDCGIYVLLFSEIVAKVMPHAGLDTKEAFRACRCVWEEQFLSVTPRQATEYRVRQRKALSDAARC